MAAREATRATYAGRPVDVVIDVRTRLEFWFGHLDGAACISVGVIASRIASHPGVHKDARILLYCASGARSAVAAGQLRALGYRRVIDGGAMSSAAAQYRRQDDTT